MNTIKSLPRIFKGSKTLPILLLILLASFIAGLPSVTKNIDDPDMIVYFNHDEGQLMDVMWYYYSGEKRETFQIEADYGLQMRYLADFARAVLSKFVTVTPGLLVCILRGINLAAVLLSILAVWLFTLRHFGEEWKAISAAALVAVRPAFPYLSTNLKPEPCVLLLTLIGLHYVLCMFEYPRSRQYLFFAAAAAAAAFLIKYAGIFILPAAIAALFFSERESGYFAGMKWGVLPARFSPLFPAVAGFFIAALPLSAVMFYVRRSTGSTWFAQYGLLGSLARNKAILFLCLTGILLIAAAALLFLISAMRRPRAGGLFGLVSKINFFALMVFGAFLGFVLVFGIRYLIDPGHFLTVYSQMGLSSSEISRIPASGGHCALYAFFGKLLKRAAHYDGIIFLTFLFYLYNQFRAGRSGDGLFYKKMTLTVFLIPFFMLAPVMQSLRPHHILPFFTVMVILSLEGVGMFVRRRGAKPPAARAVIAVFCALFIADFSVNAAASVRERAAQSGRGGDIAYKIKEWWTSEIPKDAVIVAEPYTDIYIPGGYPNIIITKSCRGKRPAEIRKLVEERRPQYLYYNAGLNPDGEMPPVSGMLPGAVRARPVKEFDNSGMPYQRRPGARFVVYSLSYGRGR